MAVLFDPFTPIGFENLFTLMWAGAIVIVIGSILVYTTAQRRYRRYPPFSPCTSGSSGRSW